MSDCDTTRLVSDKTLVHLGVCSYLNVLYTLLIITNSMCASHAENPLQKTKVSAMSAFELDLYVPFRPYIP